MSIIKITRRSALALGAGAAALPFIAKPAISQQRQRITIATGGTGGVFFVYGGGLARILSERVPNVQATAQVTGGSVDNVNLLGAGDAEIGFSTADSAYDGTQGTYAYQRAGRQDIRVIATLYDSFLHVVGSQAAGVNRVADLRGRRVSVGSAGSSTETIADRVIRAAGLNPQSDIGRDNLGVAESANALKDGKVAAFFWIGGVPTAAVRDLAQSGQPPLRFIDTSAELAGLNSRYPNAYKAFNLPANAYAGQAEPVNGLGVANVLIVSGRASNQLVTTILEGIFNNLEQVQGVHPEARRLSLQSAAQRSSVPFHPAAEAFYRARGVLS